MVNYNPFDPLTPLLLDLMKSKGQRYLVVQRFAWPGLEQGKGFLATGYDDLPTAEDHLQHLEVKEGKMIDLEDVQATVKLRPLLQAGSGYRIFYKTTPDAKWVDSFTKAYKSKIYNYIKTKARIKNDGGYEIGIKLIHGRLMAMIQSGEVSHQVLIYEMIK